MHRIKIMVLCLIVTLILGFSLAVEGQSTEAGEQGMESMMVPMGIIVLEPDGSVEQKKAAVEFPHSMHFVLDCKVCHHKWEGRNQIASCTASSCHDSVKTPQKPTKYLKYTDEGIKYYKYAYHQKCVGCHKTIKAKRKAMEMSYQTLNGKLPSTGPTGCVGCHPKQE